MTEHDVLALIEADGATFLDAYAAQAERHRGKVAIHYGDGQRVLTYGELGEVTDSIAGNLARLGIAKGDRVSVFTRDPLVATLWMMGIWKAAALFCPVNFAYEGHLLSYQLSDTAPTLIVVDPRLVGAIESARADIACPVRITVHGEHRGHGFPALDYDEFLEHADGPGLVIGPADPANVIYTSGTTGPSKGVVQSHRWVNQYTWALRQLVNADDVIYNDLPMYHVGGAFENVVRALWVGATVSLWDRFSPSEFWGRVRSTGVTNAILLDVMIAWLAGAPESPDDRANSLTKVYMQPLPLEHRAFAQRFGIDIVLAGYGQTESGVPLTAIMTELEEGEGTPPGMWRGRGLEEIISALAGCGLPFIDGKTVTRKGFMGRPAPYLEVEVHDRRDNLCPAGVAGELVVRSPAPHLILEEYLGNTEATQKALRNGWFHTGDWVVADGGLFYFVDRMGDRIRVRGENVSSFHIEEIMQKHHGVALCAVFGIPGGRGGEDEVVAVVQLKAGASATAGELRTWAAWQLPKFMRPAHIALVDEIPRTSTSKIEKYKLRAAFAEGGLDTW